MTRTALLLIDIQNDYFPGGAMECTDSNRAGENAGKLLAYARKQGIMPIHVQHISKRPGATFFLPGTAGADLHQTVAPLPGEMVIQKEFPNSFRKTSLELILRENDIEQIIIAGMMSHMCIDATTRAAADLGFSCILIHDACATRVLSFNEVKIPASFVHAAYMSALSGLYAKVCPVNEILSGSIR